MSDASIFYPLFKVLQETKIYSPKINNPDIYLDYIEDNLDNDELETEYQNYIEEYNSDELDWIYYYVYIILLFDDEISFNKDIYEKIITYIVVTYEMNI